MNRPAPAAYRSGPFLQRGLAVALFSLAAGGAAQAAQGDHWKLGVGAGLNPRYLGSDEYQVKPVPLVDVQQGMFFARSSDGVGASIIRTPGFSAGVGVNWMPGYRSGDAPDGIGKLSGTLGGRVFASTNLSGSIVTLSATQAISKRERGLLAKLSMAHPWALSEQLRIVPSIGVTWANAKYMNSYYGVDAGQSSRSGLAQHSPSSGFRDVSVRLAVNYDLSRHWSVIGGVGASRLLGDAADSPLVKEKTQVSGVAGVAYSF